ncbi:hypothetical protein OPV22_010463 [Ensete ventricosum]|uniref:3-hydroxyisobutyryl-CoA hydrolase n=1 Tax=Ensete ventricosum TaxID=4639 RepID=A0AAV8RHG9_ENSVE|nr:hypothetical protein OPV22_010463 [Ensete ventricosum]
MASGGSDNDNQVLVEGNSRVKVVVLNRPQKYNALSYQMVLSLTKKLKDFETKPGVNFVIVKAIGKTFCVGGDVAAYFRYTTTIGHWTFGPQVYRWQLMLNYLIAKYNKPQVFLINGALMGGGAGLSMNGRYKIVTENTVFAMPEAALGLFPDVGASYFLSRLPGFFGEYLGLTGTRLDGADMSACGLATHFVLSKDLPLLEKSLYEVDTADPIIIQGIIAKYAQQTTLKEESALRRLDVINKCFSKQSVEEILSCLEQQVISGNEKWITTAIKSIKTTSPISLKLFLLSIRKGRTEDLKQCLIREYRMISHVFRRTVSNDFYEGVRAKILDKDNNPKWEPTKLELVSDEMLDKYLTKLDEDEAWEDLQLPSQHGHTNPPIAKLELLNLSLCPNLSALPRHCRLLCRRRHPLLPAQDPLASPWPPEPSSDSRSPIPLSSPSSLDPQLQEQKTSVASSPSSTSLVIAPPSTSSDISSPTRSCILSFHPLQEPPSNPIRLSVGRLRHCHSSLAAVSSLSNFSSVIERHL